ncbi:MAG: site-specific integrase [Hyphomicrobiales bacterium]|nr:MAG: site-specific integrase [Hyphomicrobiales bacterium]
MTREELDRLVAQYTEATFDRIEDTLALEWSEAGLDQYRWDLNDRAHELAGALSHADPERALQLARELAPEAPEDALRKLARRLMEAQLRGIKAELLALSGEPLDRPSFAPSAILLPSITSQASTPRLSKIIASYSEERIARKNWSARSSSQYREIYGVILGLLGDRDVGAITKDDIRELGLALTKYPVNAKKTFPGLTPSEALARAVTDESVARLAPSSINMYQQAVRSLFKWAMEHDYIAQSPATVLRELKVGRAKDDRKPFDDEDLGAYFLLLDKDKVEPFLYWIPRILAYSGCRLGEVAQLQKSDIREQDSVWYFDINDDAPGKRLKTASSKREIPIHPRLLELGLLDFVGSADDFLWPADMRTNNPDRSPIDKLQKRLAHHMRKAGIQDKKKTAAHSFRHTVAERLARASAREADIAWILGHEQATITTKRYGGRPAVAQLHHVLSLLRLPV